MKIPKNAGIEGLPSFEFRDPANEGKLKRHWRYVGVDFIIRAITIATGKAYINVLFHALKYYPTLVCAPYVNRSKYYRDEDHANKHTAMLKKWGWKYKKLKMPMSSPALPRKLTIVEQNDNMCVIKDNVCYDVTDYRHLDCVGYFVKE